ncbi:hypothetical protein NDU88_005092 [Pleurodeles waltl]|uniref:Uncharacterized protein n=1 Tax=Pleurodeles waltl TaxID=8319 RepID=A0AAV7LSV0_PLEWA|nr:hypothetical protein NDU88_005092 [Pleurodeles waltl]
MRALVSTEGGVFKPTASSSEEEMDSLDTADRETPTTAMEQQREDNAGARMPEKTTTRRFPDTQWEKQEAAKRKDCPHSGKSVA